MTGDEITTSYLQYVTQDSSRKIRKQALSQYLFVCDCKKCLDEIQSNKEIRRLKALVVLGEGEGGGGESEEDSSDDDY